MQPLEWFRLAPAAAALIVLGICGGCHQKPPPVATPADVVAAQQEGKVTKKYPAVALLSLARATALMWHTQIPERATLFPSDRRDRRDIVVRVIGQILEQ